MFGDSDLAAFFDPGAFGVPVQFNGDLAYGIYDEASATMLADHGFGGFDSPKPTLQLPYNAFTPMPKEKDVIIVGETTYTIAERPRSNDLAVAVYALKVAQ